MKILFTGHRTFGNRGCEAIVRSTVAAIRKCHEDCTFLVPSDDIERDLLQWPEAGSVGVEFVPAYMPRIARYWVHSQRLPLPVIKRAGWPFPFPEWLKEQISSADMVMAIGGDNYSLDYRLPSLIQGVDSLAVKLGKPIVLWGASVGPFEAEPHYMPFIRDHLSTFNKIIVRESISYAYLVDTLGLDNVSMMVDPAFMLSPQVVGCLDFLPDHDGQGLLGINISPLMERYKAEDQSLINDTASFIRDSVVRRGLGVLLVSHVAPLDGAFKNNDYLYMERILDECADLGNRVKIMPPNYNASETKYVISQLRFFIGARTHATIAALSSGIPTISLAYSVKAVGINRDLFGDQSAVRGPQDISLVGLTESLDWMLAHEVDLRDTLAKKIPYYGDMVVAQASGLW